MTQNVYRVVTSQANDITWISPTIYLTRENVLFAASEQAKTLQKYAEMTIEEYQGHRFDSNCLRECGRDNWMTVERLWKVSDKNGYTKVIGIVSYQAV